MACPSVHTAGAVPVSHLLTAHARASGTRQRLRTRPHAVLALLVSMMGACSENSEVSMVGTLERDRVELKVENNEPLVAIHVEDGQSVTEGKLILEQDSSRAKARHAQQTALRDQAAARLAELERGPRQEAIRQSRARLESLQAQTVNAAADLLRTREMFDKGLSNQASLDRVESSAKSAQAQEQAAREELAALLSGTTPEELQQAAAAVAASQALLDQAQIDLDRTRLHAPAEGVIDKVLFEAGERPAAGATVAVLLSSARVFARIYVPENLRAGVQPGASLRVRIDGVEREYTGTVRWVSADASFTPYFALTEHDRSRLSYLAEVDIPDAGDLPAGIPLAVFPPEP